METKRPRKQPTSKCKKCVYPSKEIADDYIERKRKTIGNKFKELRSYKCEDCGKWHHTSNMTPIYLNRIRELENELKQTKKILESITTIMDTFNKKETSKELKELRKELAVKDQKLLILKNNITDLI